MSSDKENEEPVELFIENILGAEFKDYNGDLPSISSPLVIEIGTQFISMPIAVHFIEQYAQQKYFAIIKHKAEKFSNGTYRKRVFKCDLGGRYNEKLSRPVLGKNKNKGSKKQGCMWQINVTRPVNSSI